MHVFFSFPLGFDQMIDSVRFRNTQLLVERKTHDIPDDSTVVMRRPLSRLEDLIEKRKSNRGLTPTVTPTKRRSQS